MQMRSVLEFSNGANLKMILAALDAIYEEYNAILYRLPELSKEADVPRCQDEITRIHVEHEIHIAQDELAKAAKWFKNDTTGSDGMLSICKTISCKEMHMPSFQRPGFGVNLNVIVSVRVKNLQSVQ